LDKVDVMALDNCDGSVKCESCLADVGDPEPFKWLKNAKYRKHKNRKEKVNCCVLNKTRFVLAN
jgi:hypothetical protein